MDHLVHVGLRGHLHAERLLLPRLEGEAALPPLHQVGLLPRVEGGVGGEDHFDLGGEEEHQNEFEHQGQGEGKYENHEECHYADEWEDQGQCEGGDEE